MSAETVDRSGQGAWDRVTPLVDVEGGPLRTFVDGAYVAVAFSVPVIRRTCEKPADANSHIADNPAVHLLSALAQSVAVLSSPERVC